MNILATLPFLIAFFGIYIGAKLKFFMFLKPFKSIKCALESLKSKGALRSFFLSLAGTLGVGNIVGIAFGISVGGAGCIFWLIISAVFASVIKFAEAALSKDASLGNVGGVMYIIKNTLPQKFNFLAILYAALCLALSLVMGAALQARAAIESLGTPSHKSLTLAAIIICFLTFLAIRGGGEKIERLTAFIIPLAALIYISLCICVIIKSSERLPLVIKDIFASAVSHDSAIGGIGAFLLSTKIREGFCRGLLSNEAGAGTSSMAHSRNENASPAAVGLLGVFEVFIDTALLCTLTGITVLCAVPDLSLYSSGMEIISAAIASISPRLLPFLSFSITAFAYSTLICWYYYGRLCLGFFTGKYTKLFMLLYLFIIFISAFIPSDFLIISSDYLLFFMSIISLFTLVKSSDRLVKLSEQNGFINTSGKDTNSRKGGGTAI